MQDKEEEAGRENNGKENIKEWTGLPLEELSKTKDREEWKKRSTDLVWCPKGETD